MSMQKGDGSFEKRLQEGRCPSCRSELIIREKRLDCSVCALSVINVEKNGDYVVDREGGDA